MELYVLLLTLGRRQAQPTRKPRNITPKKTYMR